MARKRGSGPVGRGGKMRNIEGRGRAFSSSSEEEEEDAQSWLVPVVKNADHFNLIGLAKAVNDLAARARNNALKPDEVQEGTYTFTNIGNFGSLMGTPIINQPQVGILAIGAIRKVPAVIETKEGDFIGIRHKVILSHSYDHRIINGATGGLFVKRVAEYLENWEETLPY